MGKLVWGSRKRTKRSDLQASPRLVPVDSRLWPRRQETELLVRQSHALPLLRNQPNYTGLTVHNRGSEQVFYESV